MIEMYGSHSERGNEVLRNGDVIKGLMRFGRRAGCVQ